MPKDLYCDRCGSPEDASEDYDGLILCGYCRTKEDLNDLRREYKEKHEWVRSIWITRLAEMRKEISRLEKLYDPDPVRDCLYEEAHKEMI